MNGICLVDHVSALKVLFCKRSNKKAANPLLSYSKQQQRNSQIWEYSIQSIIFQQSLSDWQYWMIPANFAICIWKSQSKDFLFCRCILNWFCSLGWACAILKNLKLLLQLTKSLADSWLQNWPFCKPSTIVQYGLPLNIFRKCFKHPVVLAWFL